MASNIWVGVSYDTRSQSGRGTGHAVYSICARSSGRDGSICRIAGSRLLFPDGVRVPDDDCLENCQAQASWCGWPSSWIGGMAPYYARIRLRNQIISILYTDCVWRLSQLLLVDFGLHSMARSVQRLLPRPPGNLWSLIFEHKLKKLKTLKNLI